MLVYAKFVNLILILLMVVITAFSYVLLADEKGNERKMLLRIQVIMILLLHFVSYLMLWSAEKNIEIAGMYGLELFFILIYIYAFHVLYPDSSRVFLNNICCFMVLGFVMVTRINLEKGQRQFFFVFAGGLLSLILPLLMKKLRGLRKLTWVYGAAGIVALLVVLLCGKTDYGANLAIEVLGFTFQPSEFVKIIYVFFVASVLRERKHFGNIVVAGIVAAAYVLILVGATDLGSAFIYFTVFVIMVYSATRNPLYMGLGIGAGGAAAYGAYHMFSHVRNRVMVWKDPFAYVDDKGYQITQSLFAIGMGSWVGCGLYGGLPEKIPFVEKDFMFAAIVEELGVVFGVCIILLCLNTALCMIHAGKKLQESFYRLLAIGFASVYAIQVFLTVAGGMNMIPITGVTLPLVSYGGSSAVSTMLMFALVQGLNLIDEDQDGGKKKRKKSTSKKA